jgi:hypothetical protein
MLVGIFNEMLHDRIYVDFTVLLTVILIRCTHDNNLEQIRSLVQELYSTF